MSDDGYSEDFDHDHEYEDFNDLNFDDIPDFGDIDDSSLRYGYVESDHMSDSKGNQENDIFESLNIADTAISQSPQQSHNLEKSLVESPKQRSNATSEAIANINNMDKFDVNKPTFTAVNNFDLSPAQSQQDDISISQMEFPSVTSDAQSQNENARNKLHDLFRDDTFSFDDEVSHKQRKPLSLIEKQLLEFDKAVRKCMENDKKRGMMVTSVVKKDAKYSRLLLEQHLKVALQKLNSYKRENAYLLKKIDSSIILTEFDNFRSIIIEQEQKIKDLTDENKSLSKVSRTQEKSLLEMESNKIEYPEREEMIEKQMKLLENRVRLLRDHVVKGQAKEREQFHENQELKELIKKLKLKVNALLQSSGQDSLFTCDEPTVFTVNGGGTTTSLVKNSNSLHQDYTLSIDDIRSERNRLKGIIQTQRKNHKMEIQLLKGELNDSVIRRRELEHELFAREKEMKSQVLMLKQLSKSCEELSISNQKLQQASSLYKPVPAVVPPKVTQVPPSPVYHPKPPPPVARTKGPPRTRQPLMADDPEQVQGGGTGPGLGMDPKGGNFTFLTSTFE